jgi:cation diffusion facilitator CzcD-associated flavoprotein CzcO
MDARIVNGAGRIAGDQGRVTNMATEQGVSQVDGSGAALDAEVVVIGAGVSGIYQLHLLREAGFDVHLVEAGTNVGGTWYWNRYPGARFDSESYSYGYFFSPELLAEWNWSEHFAGQAETEAYLNFVVDKLGLRGLMQFRTRVAAASFDEPTATWALTTEDGRQLRSRFVVSATGVLSVPYWPAIPGRERYRGEAYHTGQWPKEPVDFAGKKVAVIGTGATGIQVIGEIADKVGELTVFQRRPNWSAPLNNSPISEQEMADIRARYDEIFATCARTTGGFLHEPDRRGFYDIPREERLKLWDRLYEEPGFGIWLANFREIFMDEAANAELSEYIADRIRRRVNDPKIAEKLIPRDHGFGVQRLPLETNYLEAYNRDNVHLVDISETPLVRVTETGLRTTMRDYEFDIIVYATGFDAITGAYDHIDIRGIGGETLFGKWKDAPSTFLGMLVHGFPNLLMPTGPQSASASTNFPRGIENGVNWCMGLLQHMWDRGYTRAEATHEAQERWTAHVVKMYEIMLMRKAKSWFTGYNSNVAGHEEGTIRYFVYNGGTPKFVGIINDVAAKGYEGIVLSSTERSSARPLAASV